MVHFQLPTGEFTIPNDVAPEFHLESPFALIKGMKNIIFDLGGVVIDLRRERAVNALKALGLEDADQMLGLYRQEEPFLGLETGRTRTADFFDMLRGKCPGASDRQLADAFDSFLVDLPVARLERLRQLREHGFRLFVLSNTNPVMFNGWICEAFRAEGRSINDYFDGIVVSFQELTCKPDPDLFSRVLSRYGLNAGETVMLDDSAANCEAARSVGMNAIRVGLSPDDDMLAITAAAL